MTDRLIKFKQRSTGEVAAPTAEVCRIEDGWTDPREDNLVEKLATSVERAATVNAIVALAERWKNWPTARHALLELLHTVEKGEHIK